MALCVIGAGFGRTGTRSLKVALETLGVSPCYHGFDLASHPEYLLVWVRAARGEKVDFAALFDSWQAAVDWPVCSFYQDLMLIYPNAKIVLTVRDPNQWYESCRATVYAASGKRGAPLPTNLPAQLPDADRPFADLMGEMLHRVIWQGTFDNRFDDHSHALNAFHRHTEEVKRNVPPDRLLIFDVAQGWGPLREFLDVPVPNDRPFPHLNDTASFAGYLQRAHSQLPEGKQ
jgi:hypothetical protein